MLNDSFLFKNLKPKGEKKIVRAKVVQTAIIGVRKLQKKKSRSPSANRQDTAKPSKRASSKSKTTDHYGPIEEPQTFNPNLQH